MSLDPERGKSWKSYLFFVKKSWRHDYEDLINDDFFYEKRVVDGVSQ